MRAVAAVVAALAIAVIASLPASGRSVAQQAPALDPLAQAAADLAIGRSDEAAEGAGG